MDHLRVLIQAALIAVVVAVGSENFYWYPIGTDVLGRALFYLPHTFVVLWAAEHFRVRRWPSVFLVAALYGLLTEGVLTPLIYSGGPLDPVLVSWTALGWHAAISFVVLFVGFRTWLIRGQLVRLGLVSLGLGIGVGVWSLTYSLPEVNVLAEQYTEQLSESTREALDEAVESDDIEVIERFRATTNLMVEERKIIDTAFDNKSWEPGRFAGWTIIVTLHLMAAHLLLGRRRPLTFRPAGRIGVAALVLLVAWYAVFIVSAVPWAPLKLTAVLLPILIGLRRNRSREESTMFVELTGRVSIASVLPIGLVAVGASVSFAIGSSLNLSDDTIRAAIYSPVPLVLTLVGWILYGYAVANTVGRDVPVSADHGGRSRW